MIAVLACAAPEPALTPTDTACTPLEWHEDRDGDGFPGQHVVRIACVGEDDESTDASDCDDGDPAVFPGAGEVCNDVDDDCDAKIDDDAIDQVTWCIDDDGDNHGGGEIVTSCDLDPSIPCDDCDDTDRNVSPSRWEVCDSADVDENCDGLADGEDASGQSVWYIDADGDGYGAGDPIESCETVEGRTRTDGDCDDSDPSVHPEAGDTCDDDLDQDCDERVDELCNAARVDVDAADARFAHANNGEAIFADLVAAVGDVTGDGTPDLAITAPAQAEAGAKAFVFDGLASGDLDTDDTTAMFASLGIWFAGVGDVDGDGLGDVSNSSNFSDSGVRIHRTPLAGTIWADDAWSSLTAPGAGSLVTGAGDVDGDGAADLLVASSWLATTVYQVTGIGPGAHELADAPAFLRGGGDPIEGALSVAVLDDDADGLAEMYVLHSDWLYVVDLPMEGDVATADARSVDLGDAPMARSPFLSSAGDWDGDGDDDLVAGAAVLGPGDEPDGTADSLVRLTCAYDGGNAESAAGGDFDGDGRTDIVIAVAREDELALGYGILSPRAGSVDVEDADFVIVADGRRGRGWAAPVAVPGDTDGDGTDDILIATPGEPAWNGIDGAAWLFRGGDWVRP